MKIFLPEQLKKVVDNQTEIQLNGNTVQEAIDNLIQNYPYVKDRLFNREGQLNRFVNIYVNDEDIRFLNGFGTSLKETDVISILPSIAGG